MADWKLIPKFRAFNKDLRFYGEDLYKRMVEEGLISEHEADQMIKWGKTTDGWRIMNEYDYTDMSVPYNHYFNDNLSEEVFNKKLDNMFDKPIPKEKWWENKKTIKLAKMPKVPKVSSKKILKGVPEFDHNIPDYEFNIPTKMTKLKPSVSSKQQSKVIKEIDNMLKDINKIIDDHKPVTIKA